MDDETFCVADVSQVRKELERFDKFTARFPCIAAIRFELERHDRTRSLRQKLLGAVMVGMAL
jgi:hypothetical protein